MRRLCRAAEREIGLYYVVTYLLSNATDEWNEKFLKTVVLLPFTVENVVLIAFEIA